MRVIAFLVFTALSITPLHAAASSVRRTMQWPWSKRVQEMFKEDGAGRDLQGGFGPFHKGVPRCATSIRSFYVRDGDKKGLLCRFYFYGARPALIGKQSGFGLKDQDGKYLIQALADVANGPGSGGVDYKWPNPVNNKIEDKSSYVEKDGRLFRRRRSLHWRQ